MSDLLKQVKDLVGGGPGGQPTTSDSQTGGRRHRSTRSRKHHKKSARKHYKSARKHHKKSGKKHYNKSEKKHRGGSVAATAALPFGLLAVQKFFQTSKGRKGLKKMSKSVRKTARRARRSI